jgi:hypothetical protein
LSSASAATCVTGVMSTFANVINAVSEQPWATVVTGSGATVVTAVTPTFAYAVTGAKTTQRSFLTSAGNHNRNRSNQCDCDPTASCKRHSGVLSSLTF